MISDIALLVIVGVIWGSTNYLIELNYREESPFNGKEKESQFHRLLRYCKNNYISFLLFLCNQSGSVLFYYCLGTISLSLTVIISNSVSFFTAVLLELFHKKKHFSQNFFIGMTLMILGLSLCSFNNTPCPTIDTTQH